MNKPLFSIALIAKNEAKTLPNLMASLKEFRERGGEICLLDTGSTDSTPELAEKYGVIVKRVGVKHLHVIEEGLANKINERFLINENPIVKPGQIYFDFGSARNESAEMCSNDWVMTVDCDEILTKFDIDKVNEAISDPGLGQVEYNFVFTHFPDGNPFITFPQSKFYNRKLMCWRGIIHEELLAKEGVAKKVFIDESVYKLEHFQNPETNRGGYLKGLAVFCYQNPEKAKHLHWFARELFWQGRPWSGEALFKKHIGMNINSFERMESMLYISMINGAMEHPKEEIEWCFKAIECDRTRREPILRLAQIYQRRDQPCASRFFAEKAMGYQWDALYGCSKEFFDMEPRWLLSWAKRGL